MVVAVVEVVEVRWVRSSRLVGLVVAVVLHRVLRGLRAVEEQRVVTRLGVEYCVLEGEVVREVRGEARSW